MAKLAAHALVVGGNDWRRECDSEGRYGTVMVGKEQSFSLGGEVLLRAAKGKRFMESWEQRKGRMIYYWEYSRLNSPVCHQPAINVSKDHNSERRNGA